MNAYKFLATGAVGRFTRFVWPTPANGMPAPWVEPKGQLAFCERGVHACAVRDLPHWLDDELWQIELDGELVNGATVLIARRGRLVGRVESWTAETAREFAGACALRARDQAVEELRLAELDAEAAALVEAESLEAIESAAREASSRAETKDARRAVAVADAAATAAEHAGVDRQVAPYLCWAAFAGFAGATIGEHREGDGGAGERRWQADWLAGRLGL